MKDFQKSKVYKWENEHVLPRFNSELKSREYLQTLVDYMWSALGNVKPPKVYTDNGYKTKSTGNRYQIRLMPSMHTEKTTIHEMAHSFNLMEDRIHDFDIHGPNYVADYCFLLHKFYGFEIEYLLFTLNKNKVKVNTVKIYDNLSKYG